MYQITTEEFRAKLFLALESKTLYVMGAFGHVANAKNKSRFNNEKNKNYINDIMMATADTFFFDCAGLIKGILWGWNADPKKLYGGAQYQANGVPDTSDLIGMCTDVSTDFNTIEPYELVYMKGHVGVYIGDGDVIECSPIWENGVQITHLGNIPKYKFGNNRTWLKHGKLPWIIYPNLVKPVSVEDKVDKMIADLNSTSNNTIYTIKKGDTLGVLASRFGTTVEEILRVNKNITDKNRIYIGQIVIIPTPKKTETYVVVKGDTLSKIAKKLTQHGLKISWQEIAKTNNIKFPYIIRVGQVLVIK